MGPGGHGPIGSGANLGDPRSRILKMKCWVSSRHRCCRCNRRHRRARRHLHQRPGCCRCHRRVRRHRWDHRERCRLRRPVRPRRLGHRCRERWMARRWNKLPMSWWASCCSGLYYPRRILRLKQASPRRQQPQMPSELQISLDSPLSLLCARAPTVPASYPLTRMANRTERNRNADSPSRAEMGYRWRAGSMAPSSRDQRCSR